MNSVAIIGDVHGELTALEALLARVDGLHDEIVFVGDYVNRGPASAEVVNLLVETSTAGRNTFVQGNHDRVFLEVLEGGDIAPLLAMGGSPTVKSYVREKLLKDVAGQLRANVPDSHKEFFRNLRPFYQKNGLLVTHGPDLPEGVDLDFKFHAYGHVVQASATPAVGLTRAAIDTGCGTLADGRLTCLTWPQKDIIQE